MIPSTIKRPTVAFFVNTLEEDYTETLCRGVIDAAEENNINLIVLPGETIQMDYIGRYNYNVIYEFVCAHNVDAIVMASSVLCQCITKAEFETFCSRFKTIPLVSIGVPIEGISSVLINSCKGLKQIVSHLIHDHHKRRIAFIKGPEGHNEAEERFVVYREALMENGLDYDPDLVVPGDFTVNSVENAIKTLMDERNVSFDAIMAANDVMAFSVLDSLRKRNILVPDQVAVTGFDNGKGAMQSTPSLTTVKQPIYEYTKKAVEIALELIKGRRSVSTILDTEMIVRESCGCQSETLQSFQSEQLRIKLGLPLEEHLKLDEISRQFIAEYLAATGLAEAKLGFLKQFILDCFRIFSLDRPDHREVETIWHSFELSVNVSGLNENDILTIQKILTSLQKTLERSKNENNLIVDDFFQRARVLVTDRLIKMQGTWLNSYRREIRNLRGLLVEMVSKINNYREQLRSVVPRLRSMGINSCYAFLYDKPIVYRRGDVWENPATVNLVMAYSDENWELPTDGYRVPWEKILSNEWLPQSKRYTLMLYPLFVEEEHLGLILMEFNMSDNYMFESLVNEMSCALKLSLLFYEREQIDNRLQEVVKELEEYNQKLNNISQTDDLTGLYNRRGFLVLAKQSLNLARKRGINGLLFFADMDGLKKINDQYGHDEGDAAIRAMGGILFRTFRSSDIISRIGGDEFTICAVDSNIRLLPTIQERLLTFTDEYNRQSEKPYQLSITLGAVPFDSAEDVPLESLISQADEVLYEQKKLKKALLDLNGY